MPTILPPEVLQAQANLTAPGIPTPTQQDPTPNMAKGRKQPAEPKRKSAAARVYPKLAQAGGET